MKTILNDIIQSRIMGERLLAVLIDPDKTIVSELPQKLDAIHKSMVTHVLVGGSEVDQSQAEKVTANISKLTHLPVILFPGSVDQISEAADALLFLSLLSGRNVDYLIGKQVEAVPKLRHSKLEIIPTGYVLIGSENIQKTIKTAVQRVSKTNPMSPENIQQIVDTAKAGEFLGMQLMYLEAGSGAGWQVPSEVISEVKNDLNIPLIVGGGIKNRKQLELAYEAGANMVVIGTAFEQDPDFFQSLKLHTKENRWL